MLHIDEGADLGYEPLTQCWPSSIVLSGERQGDVEKI